MRMVPINTEIPKGLLEVNGEALIERIIKQLHEVGIKEIYVVVGFMKEKYEYLIDEFGVELIVNSEYSTKNNLYSLKLAVGHLTNTYIVPCDIWCDRNPFHRHELYSWYMVSDLVDNESNVRVNRKMELVTVPKSSGGNAMIGICYLIKEDADIIVNRIEKFCKNPQFDDAFWEEALYNKDRMFVSAHVVHSADVVEINTYEQLREIDSDSNQLKTDAIQVICKALDSLLHGFKGISRLANMCIYMFFGLIAFVLLFGGETRYIIETGFSSLGKMMQNFIDLSTFTDPLRTSNFPQNWTIYYWAYWMVWCVAAPFFIGSISRGRTVRQTILGGYIFGVGSTLTSFIVLGNYSMGMQVTGKADFIAQYLADGDLYGMIVSIIKTMPCAPAIMIIVLITMIAFYATSFDSIALTASCYSYHILEDGKQPNKGIQLMWCILLILLPIALLFAESSMNNLQSVSIVAAFPIGAVIVMIAISFIKDAKKYLEELKEKR